MSDMIFTEMATAPSPPPTDKWKIYTRDGNVYAMADDGVEIPLTGYAVASILLNAGAGLIGGGDLSANRTFNVQANADGSIVVNANDIQVGVLATDAQHGNRGGGGLHALATTAQAGFMSSADKASLASLPGAIAANNTLITNHVNNSTGAHLASAIAYADSAAPALGATNAQLAIDQIKSWLAKGSVGPAGPLINTTTTFQTSHSWTTPALEAGDYILTVSYQWDRDATNTDFESRVLVGGTVQGELHKQEVKDSAGGGASGTDQRHLASRMVYLSAISGAQLIELEHRSQVDGAEATVWNPVFKLERVA